MTRKEGLESLAAVSYLGPVIDLHAVYARHAAEFARGREGSQIEQPYLDEVVSRHPSAGRLLDVGCGCGEPIARYFVERGWEVTGLDQVEEMLSLGRDRFPEARWIRQDMRQLDLGEVFDVVLAWDSFFHLTCEEQRSMLTRFRRHTAPEGFLLFTSGLVEGESVGGNLFGEQLFHASLDRLEYRSLLERLGYEVVLYREQDPACGGHTVWLARLVT